MVFELASKYDVGQTVKLTNGNIVTILSVEMTTLDNYYKISYLCEYTNRERRWTDEVAIMEVVEGE